MATAEELNNAYKQSQANAATAGATAPAGTTPSAGVNPPAVNGLGAGQNLLSGAYNSARTDAINQMYDNSQKAREQELQNAYNLSMSDYQAKAQQIDPNYQQKANDLAVQYERNRNNFQNAAAASGINTGTVAQESLARASQYQRDFGNLRTAQANAQAESDRQMANLTATYQSNVAKALADNDYQRAGALLDEYNNGYQRDMKNADILASYGDFSGYANLYGNDYADKMFQLWKAQNPDLAYMSGRITADEYMVMTGKQPAGFMATGTEPGGLTDGRLPAGAMGTGMSGASNFVNPYAGYKLVDGKMTNVSNMGGSGGTTPTASQLYTQVRKTASSSPSKAGAYVNNAQAQNIITADQAAYLNKTFNLNGK